MLKRRKNRTAIREANDDPGGRIGGCQSNAGLIYAGVPQLWDGKSPVDDNSRVLVIDTCLPKITEAVPVIGPDSDQTIGHGHDLVQLDEHNGRGHQADREQRRFWYRTRCSSTATVFDMIAEGHQ